MEFHVFRFKRDQDVFVVSDADHQATVSPATCGSPDDELEKVGVFPGMGKERAAFDETLAKKAIEQQGFYRFHSKTFDPVAQMPIAMP